MKAGGWVAAASVAMVVLASGPAAGRVTVTASRAELLNSGQGDTDCAVLFPQDDAALPVNVTRLRATVDETPAAPLRFEWSLPPGAAGLLLADQDIPPDEQAGVIRTLCATLGNACVLTSEQLKVYTKSSILYVAPTCDVLPEQGFKPYRGGKAKVRVKASAGSRRLGKGSISVGYGRTASLTLTLDGKTGNGVRGGLPAQLREEFVATVDPAGVALPAIARYVFDNGDGNSSTSLSSALQASATLTYSTAGKHVATAEATLSDGSALCDNLLANVESAINRIRVEVSRTPQRGSYTPGDPTTGNVAVRVRVKNVSGAQGSAVLLEGESVLSCETEVRIGSTELTTTTQIDLQHCSTTVSQSCESDADCQPTQCSDCTPGEVCLTSSYCASTLAATGVAVGCTQDADCARFDPTDTCVIVIPVSSFLIPKGKAADLIEATVPLANTLAGAAKVTETWTAQAKNAPEATTVQRYTIKSNPAVVP